MLAAAKATAGHRPSKSTKPHPMSKCSSTCAGRSAARADAPPRKSWGGGGSSSHAASPSVLGPVQQRFSQFLIPENGTVLHRFCCRLGGQPQRRVAAAGWHYCSSCVCSSPAKLHPLYPGGYTCTVVPVQSVSHLLSHRRSSVGSHPGVKSHDSSCQRLATMLRACRLRIGESGQVGPRAVPVSRDKKMAVVLPVKPS